MAQRLKDQAIQFYITHDSKKIVLAFLIFYVVYLTRHFQTKLITIDHSHHDSVAGSFISTDSLEDGKCPMIPPNLKTRIKIDLVPNRTYDEINGFLKNLTIKPGGLSQPKECKSNTKVAIIIPYRNRENNLKLFLKHIHPFLNKQQLDYAIYLIEPLEKLEFNRGLLMNIGFLEARKMSEDYWECFILHDIDLLPEDERNLYTCSDMPRHMSAAVSTFKYKLPYESIFGGVTAIRKEQMVKANGFSNLYFGWGGEDDDFRKRFVNKKYSIFRYPLEIGRYYMGKHEKDKNINAQRFNLLASVDMRQDKDGLNSIKYEVVDTELNPLYTKIKVSYDKQALFAGIPLGTSKKQPKKF